VEPICFRVLVVDDYEPWRSFVNSMLQQKPGVLVADEVSDGITAIEKARELRPDLILLDVGLPGLNGVPAARRIRDVAPQSNIVFVSENRASDVVTEALRTGALGYVLKSDVVRDLWPAMEAALQGRLYLSRGLAGFHAPENANANRTDHAARRNSVSERLFESAETWGKHEVEFYSDDRLLLDHVTQFIGEALGRGEAAIVIATEPHLKGLVPGLMAYGPGMAAAIRTGRYSALQAADALAMFMPEGKIDPVRFNDALGNLIQTAQATVKGGRPRVAIFGEGTALLCEQGNLDAAVELEKLCTEAAKQYEVNILCAYSVVSLEGGAGGHTFQRLCAEHSAVYTL
jgi:DNA-binding NarL/FixJ family response regulator